MAGIRFESVDIIESACEWAKSSLFIFGNTEVGRVFSPRQDNKEGILQHDLVTTDETISRCVVGVILRGSSNRST